MSPIINPGPVFSAGKRKLNEQVAPVPNMRSTLLGWVKPITMTRITSTVKDGQATPVEREVKTSGVLLAGDPVKLQMLAEGDRSWESVVLYVFDNLVLETNDRAVIRGVKYRVLQKLDWTAYGYQRFDLLKDYQ